MLKNGWINEVKNLLPELKGVTREQFSKDLDLQNKIFEKSFKNSRKK